MLCFTGCDCKDDKVGGFPLAVEGLHTILHAPGTTHRTHLYLPRADEQVLQADGAG